MLVYCWATVNDDGPALNHHYPVFVGLATVPPIIIWCHDYVHHVHIHGFTFTTLTYFCINYEEQTFVEIIINALVSSSASFEYLCYGSTVIINIFILTVWGSTLDFR